MSSPTKNLYTSHSGLALVGLAVNRHMELSRAQKAAIPQRHGISHGDIAKSYLGLLCLGKSDFEAVSNVCEDAFLHRALRIQLVPSAERLRQRLDEHAEAMLPIIDETNIAFPTNAKVPVCPVALGHVALDIDVFPMGNSGTKKAGVSRAYHGYDGYAPIAAYLGNEGWCLACELREGTQHSHKQFGYVRERVISWARRLTELPLLLRMDSAHDALENRASCVAKASTSSSSGIRANWTSSTGLPMPKRTDTGMSPAKASGWRYSRSMRRRPTRARAIDFVG